MIKVISMIMAVLLSAGAGLSAVQNDYESDITFATEESTALYEEATEGETVGGKCIVTYGWLEPEERPDTDLYWKLEDGVLTIYGEGGMHEFYYTYGGRDVKNVNLGRPWDGHYTEVEKVVIEEGVSSICRWAFTVCKNIKEVVIPDGVVIYEGAFENLDNLTEVTLGEGCTLGKKAFYDCDGLLSFNVTKGTSVLEETFADCSNLSNIVFEDGSIDLYNNTFNSTPFYDNTDEIYADNSLLWIKNRDFENYTVKEGTKRIGRYVFSYLSKIKSVSFPESLEEIRERAFEGCRGLETADLPEGVKTIGDRAFNSCGRLKGVKLPEGLEYVGKKAFAWTKIEEATIRKGVVFGETGGNPYGSDGVFQCCENLKKVTIEDGVEKIPADMFDGCISLEEINLPQSVWEIGDYAFKDCDALEVLDTKNVKKIGRGAFSYCANIMKMDISSAEDLGAKIFENSINLEEVKLSENITKIPYRMFAGCEKLYKVDIPQSVTEFGDEAFKGCDRLREIPSVTE